MAAANRTLFSFLGRVPRPSRHRRPARPLSGTTRRGCLRPPRSSPWLFSTTQPPPNLPAQRRISHLSGLCHSPAAWSTSRMPGRSPMSRSSSSARSRRRSASSPTRHGWAPATLEPTRTAVSSSCSPPNRSPIPRLRVALSISHPGVHPEKVRSIRARNDRPPPIAGRPAILRNDPARAVLSTPRTSSHRPASPPLRSVFPGELVME